MTKRFKGLLIWSRPLKTVTNHFQASLGKAWQTNKKFLASNRLRAFPTVLKNTIETGRKAFKRNKSFVMPCQALCAVFQKRFKVSVTRRDKAL